MANVLVKRGQLDNVATYEHFCDTTADMENINPKEINLGSVCVVLKGKSGGMEVYLATSEKEWIQFNLGGKTPDTPMDKDTIKDIINSDEPVVSIKLNESLDLNEPFVIQSGKNVTINLNNQNIETSSTLFNVTGGTLTIDGEGIINVNGNIANVTNGGKLIINGGTFDSTANNYGAAAIGVGSSVEFNNGDLSTTEAGLMAFDGGSVIMNGGTIHTRDNFAIGTNGSAGYGGNVIIMNGGQIDAHITSNGYEAIGIYLPNDDTFIMNDGIVNVVEGAGIVQRGGSCSIRGGSITVNGTPGHTGWVGDNKTKMSESAVIYHQTANYPAKDTIHLSISGGTFVGVDHSVEILSDEETPNISITGGSFTPPLE